MQRILCILALLGYGCLGSELAREAEWRLVDQPAGRGQRSGRIEFQRGVTAHDQVLADEEGDKEQRQDSERTKTPEVAQLSEAGARDAGARESHNNYRGR